MSQKLAIFTDMLLENRAGLRGGLAGKLSGKPTFEWR
jgi:hypothetical protein